jgi:hypothetical protein
MRAALDQLKAFAAAAAAPLSSLERRVMAETGLPVVWDRDPDPTYAAIERRLKQHAAAHDFNAIAKAFDALFADKQFCGNGYRTYRVVPPLLLGPIEAAAMAGDAPFVAKSLEMFAAWWAADKTDPAAAAIYARALTVAGYARSAQGVAERSAPDALSELRDTCGFARSVLAHAGSLGRRHWLWRQADFVLTFVAWNAGVEDEDALLPSFAAVQTLDPYEFGIYDDRAVQLLPHWAGRGAGPTSGSRTLGAVDQFARAAVERTANRFGELMYARVYDNVLGFEDAECTLVDPDRLLAGFADWYQRFPSQALANRYAAHAHAFGDDACVANLFRTALSEIHPDHWFDHSQPLEAWRSAGRVGGG